MRSHHSPLVRSRLLHFDTMKHDVLVSDLAQDESAILSGTTLSPSAAQSAAQTVAGGAAYQRFVAGDEFFNYDNCGSLRPGQDPIKLFSFHYVGLAVHVVLVGFAFHFFSYGYGSLLAEYLKVNDEQQVKAANYMLVWPQALSIFVGLCSDAFPIFGFRRKSYMLLGWVLSCIVFITIVLLDLATHSGDQLTALAKPGSESSSRDTSLRRSPLPIVYIVLSLVAGIAIQISWLAAATASVEYAQRERIHYRGQLQATLLSLYYFGGFCARILIAFIVQNNVEHGENIATVSLGYAAALLAGVSLFAIPFVVYCFDEDPLIQSNSVTIDLGERLSHFWKFCHYNVVYRVLFFIGLHLFLLGMYNQNVRDSVQKWSHVSKQDSLFVEASRLAVQTLSTIHWRDYLRNTSWRALAFWGPAAYILLYTTLSLCATYDISRSVWFYGIIVSLADIPRAWIILYSLILSTEIAEIGHEGVTLTLGMSFKGLAGLADYTLAAIFPQLFGFKVSTSQVEADSPATRRNVTIAMLISVAFNLLSFTVISLPPRQKLDAQQMRAFGGYNRFAGWALVVLFAVFTSFNLTVNLLVVL